MHKKKNICCLKCSPVARSVHHVGSPCKAVEFGGDHKGKDGGKLAQKVVVKRGVKKVKADPSLDLEAEVKAEDLKAELKAKDLKEEAKAEDLKAEFKEEDVKEEVKAEDLKAEFKAEDLKEEVKAELLEEVERDVFRAEYVMVEPEEAEEEDVEVIESTIPTPGLPICHLARPPTLKLLVSQVALPSNWSAQRCRDRLMQRLTASHALSPRTRDRMPRSRNRAKNTRRTSIRRRKTKRTGKKRRIRNKKK